VDSYYWPIIIAKGVWLALAPIGILWLGNVAADAARRRYRRRLHAALSK
jgi:hypothetical protein